MLKEPDAILDYTINLRSPDNPWLEDGEAIASFIWTVPTGLTKVAEDTDTDMSTVWLSGGTLGVTYRVNGEWTTTNTPVARVDSRDIVIEIVQRTV